MVYSVCYAGTWMNCSIQKADPEDDSHTRQWEEPVL